MEADSAAAFENLHEIVQRARQNLDQNNWDYIVGGTETETTLRRNRLARDSLALRPRVLRDVRDIDPGCTAFGRRLRLPVLLAPVGALEAFHEGAAGSVALAAGRFGVAHMLSSVCLPGLEEVAAAAPDALRLYQLYVRGDDAYVADHVARAIACGYAGFCLTVDTQVYSRRERDLAKRYQPAAARRAGFAPAQTRPATLQASLSWDLVRRIKDRFSIPLVLKGIACAEDASLAVENGVDVVYVSNHGGRQLDQGRGTLDMLPEVARAVGGRARVIVDGGVLRGTDVLKALALGADAVGIGRMQGMALAAGGTAGVVRMLELLETEIRTNLALMGLSSIDQLNPNCVLPAEPVVRPHVLSGFPLLDEGY